MKVKLIKKYMRPESTSALPFPFAIPLSILTSDLCGSPVVEVHYGLDGVPSSCGDVSLKARKQRGDNVHAVLLTLPVRKHSGMRRDGQAASVKSCEAKFK